MPLRRRWPLLAIPALAALAGVSLAAALGHALDLGQDLQWSPTRLFLEGRNPYAHYLAGNPDGALILEQAPNYAHALYVALTPLALLPFEGARLAWIVVNLALTCGLTWWLGGAAQLPRHARVGLLLAVIASLPFRTTVANGQMALVSLAGLCALIAPSRPLTGALASLAYVKYSFALPAAVWLWSARGPRLFLWSALPMAAGFALFLAHVGGSPWRVLTQPLEVSRIATYHGVGDLMTVLDVATGSTTTGRLWIYVVAVASSVVAGVATARHVADPLRAVALLSMASLLCFRHLIYDWVALLPAAAWALAHHDRLRARIALGLIAYFWYGFKGLLWIGEAIERWPPVLVEHGAHLLLGMLLFWSVWPSRHERAA